MWTEIRSGKLYAMDVPTRACRALTVLISRLPAWWPLSTPNKTARSPEELADVKGWTPPTSKPETQRLASNISKVREDAQPATRQPETLPGLHRVTRAFSLRSRCCIPNTRNRGLRLHLLLVKRSRARWHTSMSLPSDSLTLRVRIDPGGPAMCS